jgi:glycosyltransferase involved in cell wall biosynthesis
MGRIVMFVFNDCTADARVLREAGSLAAAGHEVTIMARPRNLEDSNEEVEAKGGFTIVRVPVPVAMRTWWVALRNPWRARGDMVRLTWAMLRSGPAGWLRVAGMAVLGVLTLPIVLIRGASTGVRVARGRPKRPLGGEFEYLGRWVFSILGWGRAAARRAPVADVYHGHDMTGLPAAAWAASWHDAALVYDSHEIFLESGGHATRGRFVRWLFGRLERRWSGHAAALVTVNRSLAEQLQRRLRPKRVVVVHNCAPRWDPPATRSTLLRELFAIPAEAPIALYHGGFSRHRGMEELALAALEPGMDRVHVVYLGYGSLRDELLALAADATYGGRLHVADKVPPEELLPWVASADVGVMPIQASTLNHLLSTPNKLFESLAAGVPVVASDFPEMHRIVADDPSGPLGELCKPDDPADIARAIRAIVDQPLAARAALRARCLEAAHERWNWEHEVAGLLELYRELMERAPRAVA